MTRCVVIGCLEETIETLNILKSYNFLPDHIITLPQECVKETITNYVDLEEWSKNHGIPISFVQSYSMKSEYDFHLIKNLNPQIILVIGWQRLIPSEILSLTKYGVIGFHGSSNFLPWGRGRSPINWSIIEGRNRFILHMFLIKPGVDDGDIIGMEVYDINQYDTCRSVYYKTAFGQAKLISKYVPKLLEGITSTFPQIGEPFYYEKRTPKDGKINWDTMVTEDLCRLVRAVTMPYPGAFTYLKEKEDNEVKIWSAQSFSNDLIIPNSLPGEIIFISHNSKEFVVKTKDGSVLVTEYNSNIKLNIGDILI